VLETRDAANNIVDADGRIPIIVRRLGVTATAPSELAARPE
jgi:hypothetical protein